MPLVGFKPMTPAGKWPQTYALDCAATGTKPLNKVKVLYFNNVWLLLMFLSEMQLPHSSRWPYLACSKTKQTSNGDVESTFFRSLRTRNTSEKYLCICSLIQVSFNLYTPCVLYLGQAFCYSPENTFYIYLINKYISLSDICLTVHH